MRLCKLKYSESMWFHTVCKYRRYLRMVVFVSTVGNKLLHCVLAVMTVVTTVLQKQLLYFATVLKYRMAI